MKAELAGDAVQTVHIAKLSVIDGIRSDNFNHFIENTVYEDNHHWPVAIMSPARGQQLGLPQNARVVQVSSQNVVGHRKHWVDNFKGGEWELVQELIDHGNFKIEEDDIVIIDVAGGKPWKLVIKGTSSGEIYIKTYHREEARRLIR